jgi:hypothetical protein
MSSTTLRILFVAALVLVALTVVMSAAYAQTGTATPMAAATAMTTTTTPGTLPTTGGSDSPASTATVVLLALGATTGLGGLLLRGLRQPR